MARASSFLVDGECDCRKNLSSSTTDVNTTSTSATLSPSYEVIRFFVIGDAGSPGARARRVAAAMRRRSALYRQHDINGDTRASFIPDAVNDASAATVIQDGEVSGGGGAHQTGFIRSIDFGLMLGDNFYPFGVRSVDDPLFDTVFHDIFGNLPSPQRPETGQQQQLAETQQQQQQQQPPEQDADSWPYFGVLGNHDYLGVAAAQIDYTFTETNRVRGQRWNIPAPCYAFVYPPAVALRAHTNQTVSPTDGAFSVDATLPVLLPAEADTLLGKLELVESVLDHPRAPTKSDGGSTGTNHAAPRGIVGQELDRCSQTVQFELLCQLGQQKPTCVLPATASPEPVAVDLVGTVPIVDADTTAPPAPERSRHGHFRPLLRVVAVDTNGVDASCNKVGRRNKVPGRTAPPKPAVSAAFLRAAMQQEPHALFTVAFGHHPLHTRGVNYNKRGIQLRQHGFQKAMLEAGVCVYFAGHQHVMQHYRSAHLEDDGSAVNLSSTGGDSEDSSEDDGIGAAYYPDDEFSGDDNEDDNVSAFELNCSVVPPPESSAEHVMDHVVCGASGGQRTHYAQATGTPYGKNMWHDERYNDGFLSVTVCAVHGVVTSFVAAGREPVTPRDKPSVESRNPRHADRVLRVVQSGIAT